MGILGFILLFDALIFGIPCAVVASKKGGSGFLWFILGLLFGPITLIIALLMPYKPRPINNDIPHVEFKIWTSYCQLLGVVLLIVSIITLGALHWDYVVFFGHEFQTGGLIGRVFADFLDDRLSALGSHTLLIGMFLIGVFLIGISIFRGKTTRRLLGDTEAAQSEQMKKCPFCAESIKFEAVLCRYCKSTLPKEETPVFDNEIVELTETEPESGPASRSAEPFTSGYSKKNNSTTYLIAGAIVTLITLVVIAYAYYSKSVSGRRAISGLSSNESSEPSKPQQPAKSITESEQPILGESRELTTISGTVHVTIDERLVVDDLGYVGSGGEVCFDVNKTKMDRRGLNEQGRIFIQCGVSDKSQSRLVSLDPISPRVLVSGDMYTHYCFQLPPDVTCFTIQWVPQGESDPVKSQQGNEEPIHRTQGDKVASAVITSPKEGETVAKSCLVTGSISGIGGNVRAFLLIQSTAAQFGQRLYPQGEIVPGEDGKWTLGGIYASPNYNYRTYVVATENPGSAQLLIDQESRTKGLEQLPGDTKIISSPILVSRNGTKSTPAGEGLSSTPGLDSADNISEPTAKPGSRNAVGVAEDATRTFTGSSPWGDIRIIIDEEAMQALQIEDIKTEYTPAVYHSQFDLYGLRFSRAEKGHGEVSAVVYRVNAMGKREKINAITYTTPTYLFKWYGKLGIFSCIVPWNEMHIHLAHSKNIKALQNKTTPIGNEDITGSYEGTLEQCDGTLKLKELGNNKVSVNLEAAGPGCMGTLEGSGTFSGNTVKSIKTEDSYPCGLTITVKNSEATIVEKDCSYYHGAGCGFSGKLMKTGETAQGLSSTLKPDSADNISEPRAKQGTRDSVAVMRALAINGPVPGSKVAGVSGASPASGANGTISAAALLYYEGVRNAIRQEFKLPDQDVGVLEASALIVVSRNGQVLKLQIEKPSGNDQLDAAALEAIKKAKIPVMPPVMDRQKQDFRLKFSARGVSSN